MQVTKFLALSCLSLIIGMQGCNLSKSEQKWGNITIDVKADNAVEAKYTLAHQKNGLEQLDITLTNKGTEIASIDSIVVRIPVIKPITHEMKVAFGSSRMGQHPMVVKNMGETVQNGKSFMFAMVQMSHNKYILAGSLSWRVFMPKISLENNTYVVRSNGQGKQLKPGESIKYEQIVLSSGADYQEILDTLGWAIAEANDIKKLKEADYRGWATWDYYAYQFSDKDIYENIEQIKQINPSVNLIQIDAGWYTQRGDFANSRLDFPGGMKAIADSIKSAGMTPGIWIDGFRANTDSEVYKNHPEYFLHDNEGNIIVQSRKTEGPDKDRVYMDYSHPGARAHIAECMRVITKEMGIPYVKIDFIALGLNDEILAVNKTFKSVKPFDASMTDVERLRLGLQTMRQAAGTDCYILGCSGVFGPMIGLVDGMRTGGDVSPRFEAFPERVLANGGNAYLCGKVFNGDADYLVLREAADEDESVSDEKVKNGGSLTINEAQMWADFNKLYGVCRLSSDKLKTLRSERKALVKDVFDYPPMDETIPLDFWQHGKDKSDGYELMLARNEKEIYLGVFNWSDATKEYNLDAFDSGVQKLNARHSLVLKYSGKKSFNEIRKNFTANLNKQ